jgi:hypothetical protein
MEYQEHPLPPDLDCFVAAIWTLRCGGARDTILDHSAPPDGCVELIRRLAGWSRWGRRTQYDAAKGDEPVRAANSRAKVNAAAF